MNAKWLDKRLAKCPPASWREETRILEEFNRIRLVKERKREGRRGLREAQAQLPPRVINYRQEAKITVTSGADSQTEVDDGGGGGTEGSSESEGDPDRPKKRESVRSLRADYAQTAEQKRKEKIRREDKDIKPSSSSGDDESSFKKFLALLRRFSGESR